MVYCLQGETAMRSLRLDVRYGLRQIKQSHLFAAVTIISLALGIGANTAIFSLLDALTLRNLPVWRRDRLVEIAETYRKWSEGSVFVFRFSAVARETASLHRPLRLDRRLALQRVD